MTTWKTVLLVYSTIDVRYPIGRWRSQRFAHELTPAEIEEASRSFRGFPLLVAELTDRRASVDYSIIHVDHPLRSVSPISWGGFWPSPDDVQAELQQHAPVGAVDSVFVLWPQSDFARRRAIPSGGWGFGMGATATTNGATYATVANALPEVWRIPRVGEVWLHEWLHGVCHHFRVRGEEMPDGDADGGGRHGYVQSPTTGWSEYYRDLMNARVRENGKLLGIASTAWLDRASPRTLAA